jgi:hypothetical protein
MSLGEVSPEAMEAYLCLAAVRCTGAPPEATIHAGVALAELLNSNGEMTPEGFAEVYAAAEQGMRDLEWAEDIAADFLPDARLTVLGDPYRDQLNDEIRRILSDNETVQDLLIARRLPAAHTTLADGTPRIGPLPGVPAEVGQLGLSDGPVAGDAGGDDLAGRAGVRGGNLSGAGARGPRDRLSDPRLVGDAQRAAQSRAAGRPRRAEPVVARLLVVVPERSGLRGHARRVGARGDEQGTPAPAHARGEPPIPFTSERPQVPAPGEVAQLTRRAQTEVLEALFHNLPPSTTGFRTFADFTTALLGPRRVSKQDSTFSVDGEVLDAAPGAVTDQGASGQPQASVLPGSSDAAAPAPVPAYPPPTGGSGTPRVGRARPDGTDGRTGRAAGGRGRWPAGWCRDRPGAAAARGPHR